MTIPSGYEIPSMIEGIGDESDLIARGERPLEVRRLPPRPAFTQPQEVPPTPEKPAPRQHLRKASSTWLPRGLVELVREEYSARGVAAGELFKLALEKAAPRLAELVAQSRAERVAEGEPGSLFDTLRVGRAQPLHSASEPINYRLLPADFVVLDRLVEQTGATSRGQLIACALNHYFQERTHNKE